MTTLATLRLSVGLTQEELARQVGLSRQSYIAIEHQEASPRVEIALRIARVLGSSVEELFARDASPQPDRTQQRLTGAVVGLVRGQEVVRPVSELSPSSFIHPADLLISKEKTRPSGPPEVLQRFGSSYFFSGCDPILGLITERLSGLHQGTRARWFTLSNRRAATELREGRCHFALQHAPSGQTTAIEGTKSIPLVTWELGLAYRANTALKARSLDDLVGRNIRVALREEGSGVRAFLEDWVAKRGTTLEAAFPHSVVCGGHFEVAQAVAEERADFGITLTWAAIQSGLSVEMLGEQRSFLHYYPDEQPTRILEQVQELVTSPSSRREINSLDGYLSS